MQEEWRDIPGYAGSYQVSDQGRVRSVDRTVWRQFNCGRPPAAIKYKGKVLRARPKQTGHAVVNLGAGSCTTVHRLVLLAFVGPPPAGHECLHINGVPSDNRLENLRWGTRLENKADERYHAQLYGRRQGSTHLSIETIRQIKRELCDPRRPSQRVLAAKYGVHYNTISNISRCFTHKWIEP